MALAFLNLEANHKAFSEAAIWVSTDAGVTWIRLSRSAELTITSETTESEVVDNRGHGHFDDAAKNFIIEGKFIERGEDVRQLWTNDTDQEMRGKDYALWIQGAKLSIVAGTAIYEQWCFYKARLKRNFGSYALGTADVMFTFTFYAMANDTCATVTITAPTGDPCYKGVATGTAAIANGEFHLTMDTIAA